MDTEFSQEDLEFQKEVQDFIEENLPKGGDMWSGRSNWFQALKEKGGWILPMLLLRKW